MKIQNLTENIGFKSFTYTLAEADFHQILVTFKINHLESHLEIKDSGLQKVTFGGPRQGLGRGW